MIDEATVEDRLRRTYANVAARTTLTAHAVPVALADDSNASVRARRLPRRPQLALIGFVAFALAVSGALIVGRDGTHRVEVTGPSPSTAASTAASTSSSAAPAPVAIAGTEQTIASGAPPSDIAVFFAPVGKKWQTASGGSPHGYRVNGATAFDVDNVLALADGYPAGPGYEAGEDQSSCTFYDGTLPIGGQGYGIEVSCVPLADIAAGTKHGVFLFPDFPKPAQDTTVWSHIPARTAFVTFTGDGIAPLWERPVDGVAGFTVPVSRDYTGDNYRTAPHPVLRAYDADGNVLTQFVSPYLVNFITTAPGSGS